MHNGCSINDTTLKGLLGSLLLCISACSGEPSANDHGVQAKSNPSLPISTAAGTSTASSAGAPQAGRGMAITMVGTSAGTLAPPSAAASAGRFASSAGAAPPISQAQAGAVATGPAPMAGPALGTGTTCLKPGNGMYTNPGPYKVAMKEVDLGMIEASQHTGKFTIYYPSPLETGCLHPIVAWGNGTGVTGSGTYAFLNSNAASWGMVVAESQEDNTGSGNFHKAGVDYLLKQNADSSSMFYQKLSTRAGVSGHSQGGFGASMGAAHPNVVTAAIEGATMVASAKVSVLVLTGTKDIVMNAESLVNNAKGPMFVADWEGGDHVTTETVAGTISGDKGTLQFTRLYAAWFRCTLGDDPVACKMFMGGAPGNCGICKDMGWHGLASKNL